VCLSLRQDCGDDGRVSSTANSVTHSMQLPRTHRVKQAIAPGTAKRYDPRAMAVRRWHKSRRTTSVHGRVRSPHISAGRRWLSCRQPACYSLGSCAMGHTDRQTDGSRYSKMFPVGRRHNNSKNYPIVIMLVFIKTRNY